MVFEVGKMGGQGMGIGGTIKGFVLNVLRNVKFENLVRHQMSVGIWTSKRRFELKIGICELTVLKATEMDDEII